MHRIDGAGHVNNRFVPEDIATSRPPTEITSEWMNAVQEESMSILKAAGIEPEKENNAQLLVALCKLFPSLGDLQNQDDVDLGASIVGQSIQVISTMAVLRTIAGNTNRRLFLMGYSSDHDGGQGLFVWSASYAGADDGGIHIIPTGHVGSGAWVRNARGLINVRFFGAKGDGVADDSTAVIAALNSASQNQTFIFPTGRYKFNSPLGSFGLNDVVIDFQGSVLDFSSLPLESVGPLLEIAGTYGLTQQLSANAADRVKILALNSYGFVAGDMVRLYSNKVWDRTRTGTRYGELNFIDSLDGASVTLTTEVQTHYTIADSATLQRITPVRNVTLRNGFLLGPSGNDQLMGIQIVAGIGCLVDNIKSKDVDKVHLRLTDCVFSKVTNSHFEQSNHSAQAYGVSFCDASQDCSAISNSFVDVRHSMTTNNTVASSWGVTRRILFMGNIVSDSSKATGGSGGDAIDTHAGSEDISIVSNILNSSSGSGINVESRSAIVKGNTIVNAAVYGIFIHPYADTLPSAFTVEGNTMFKTGDAGSDYGINIVVQTEDCASMIVNGNRISSYSTPIRLNAVFPYYFNKTSINGNVVAVADGIASLYGIEVNRAKRLSVSGNSVKAGGAAIILTDCNNFTVSGNAVEIFNTSGSSGYGIRVVGTSDHGAIVGNSALYSAGGIAATIGVSLAPDTVTYTGVWGNTTNGFGTPVNIGTGIGNAAANNI